jgi:hypothetical protein
MIVGVEAWMVQPASVVMVTADPAALMDKVVPDRLNVTISVGGFTNR